MNWKQFKEDVESKGMTDESIVRIGFVDCMDCIEVVMRDGVHWIGD